MKKLLLALIGAAGGATVVAATVVGIHHMNQSNQAEQMSAGVESSVTAVENETTYQESKAPTVEEVHAGCIQDAYHQYVQNEGGAPIEAVDFATFTEKEMAEYKMTACQAYFHQGCHCYSAMLTFSSPEQVQELVNQYVAENECFTAANNRGFYADLYVTDSSSKEFAVLTDHQTFILLADRKGGFRSDAVTFAEIFLERYEDFMTDRTSTQVFEYEEDHPMGPSDYIVNESMYDTPEYWEKVLANPYVINIDGESTSILGEKLYFTTYEVPDGEVVGEASFEFNGQNYHYLLMKSITGDKVNLYYLADDETYEITEEDGSIPYILVAAEEDSRILIYLMNHAGKPMDSYVINK